MLSLMERGLDGLRSVWRENEVRNIYMYVCMLELVLEHE